MVMVRTVHLTLFLARIVSTALYLQGRFFLMPPARPPPSIDPATGTAPGSTAGVGCPTASVYRPSLIRTTGTQTGVGCKSRLGLSLAFPSGTARNGGRRSINFLYRYGEPSTVRKRAVRTYLRTRMRTRTDRKHLA